MCRQNSPCLRFLYSNCSGGAGGLTWWMARALRHVARSLRSVFRIEVGVQVGVVAQRLQRDLGVAFGVTVADDHRDVAADALGAERGGGERRRHRKEIDRSVVARAENRAELGSGHVHAVDRRRRRAAARRPRAGCWRLERVARVGDDQSSTSPARARAAPTASSHRERCR